MNIYTPDSNRVTHYANVDFTTRTFIDTVHLVQYDNRLPILAVRLFQNGVDYNVIDADRVQLRCAKFDKTFIILDALGVSENGATAYFELNAQLTVESGEHTAIIDVIFETTVMNNASSPIPIVIDKNPVTEDMIESLTDFKALVEYRDEALQYKNDANESAVYLSEFLAEGFRYQFVDILPLEPDKRTIYLILKSGETDIYEQWVYGADNVWHRIGLVHGDLIVDADVSIAPEDWNSETREAIKTVSGVTKYNKVYVFNYDNTYEHYAYCKSQDTNKLIFGFMYDDIPIPEETITFSIQIVNPTISND